MLNKKKPKKSLTARKSETMPPKSDLKWDQLNESLMELKKQHRIVTDELGKDLMAELREMKKQIEPLNKAMAEIKQLRQENEKKDQLIKELGNKVEELDQQGKLNDVIVTGLIIKPPTYAAAVAAGNSAHEPGESEMKSVEKQVSEFLNGKGIEVNFGNVEVCYLLPRRKESATRAVILKFINRKYKTALLKQGKKLKGSNVYINENLTRKNADIARTARQLKKDGKIQHTWTANCRIYIKTNGASAEEVKIIQIRSKDELEKYNN